MKTAGASISTFNSRSYRRQCIMRDFASIRSISVALAFALETHRLRGLLSLHPVDAVLDGAYVTVQESPMTAISLAISTTSYFCRRDSAFQAHCFRFVE